MVIELREFLDDAIEFPDVLHARVACAEARVRREVAPLHSAEQARREGFRRSANRDEAVFGGIDAKRRQSRNGLARALLHAAPLQQVERLARHHGSHHSEHGDIDVLAEPGSLRLVQRRQQSDHTEQRRVQVGERHSHAHGRISSGSGRHHDSAQRLDDGVHCLARAGLAVGAKSRDRAIDNARIDLAREGVARANAVERAAAQVLHHHVSSANQVGEHFPSLGLLQIQGDRLLVRKRLRAETETSSGRSLTRLGPCWPRYGAFVRHVSGPSGFSILITRAPKPANNSVAKGPASAVVKSRTVTSVSGRGSSFEHCIVRSQVSQYAAGEREARKSDCIPHVHRVQLEETAFWYAGEVKPAHDDRYSMRELAYLHIQKKIASRVLRAGTPVSELPIARELGISRTPTREAIRQLVAEGLLEEVPGRGVVVVTLERHDIEEIYEVRKALEVEAARKAAERSAGPMELQNLRKVADEVERLIQDLKRSGKESLDPKQMSRFEAADIGFHIYLMQIAGNTRSLTLVKQLRSLIRIFAMRRTGHSLELLNRIHKDHCDLIAAIEARDPERAAAVSSAHIQAGHLARLEQFDQRERESALPQDVSAFIDEIQADMV